MRNMSATTPLGQQFQVQDGVTTTLELESGAYPVTEFGIHEPIALAYKSLYPLLLEGHQVCSGHVSDPHECDNYLDTGGRNKV